MAAKEKLIIPNEVVKADWKDDVDVDYATYGNNKQEREYVSPKDVPPDTIEKIKARKNGHTVLTIFTKSDKLAA